MKRYPAETNDAIYALMREGHGPTEIVFRLKRQKAGLDYEIDMPYRTCQEYMKRLRRERGVPVPTIEPGQEYDAAVTLRREALEMARQELVKLKRVSTNTDKPMAGTDLEKLVKLTRLLDDMARREEKKRSSADPDPEPEKGSANRGFLKQLAKLSKEEPNVSGQFD